MSSLYLDIVNDVPRIVKKLNWELLLTSKFESTTTVSPAVTNTSSVPLYTVSSVDVTEYPGIGI